ncbi:hypothetical protein E3Z27_16495 [Pseudomonas mediterranea]|uniref:Uncharacterized protein n=1 Tax=Pseudomonas mediterranea TaxID=183795 RepID=A0AAX2DCG9_9PSED|nr:hypothetical protein [Pseudomonas mediterranea]KGU86246.1 hypothetical protein N005_09370 [Pseudomonas mediterranea CFBP 5447]MDU9030033.1 hypothetical protein [Pseudomonas mediterranea]QHA83160.1 hypothetical protein E3Z27_16495 [Pseudomonas mediterranea]UZD98981.1 hypothetical protein LOY71_15660 [Pseudomonas mediterranea]CAH0260601.1 hypothetical protein SRABI112_03360 [Pseudomonas mediterranea]
MAGDLILASVNDSTLTTLTDAGGKMGVEIYHADKYSQQNWDLLRARVAEATTGSVTNNRSGLPPHFYISFRQSDYKGSGSDKFKKLIRHATRPLTVVSSHPGLTNWTSQTGDEVSAENCFREALQKGNVTLEIYKYDAHDLINRTTGAVNDNISYMKLIDE